MRCAAVLSSITAAVILGCEPNVLVEPAIGAGEALMAKGGGQPKGDEFATRTPLPALNTSVHGEAYAVNRAGSLIGGYSWDQTGLMHPVTWSLQNGAWTITSFPWDASATSAVIRAVNDQGDKAGTFWPASAPRPVIWHAAGGFTVLGCGEPGEGRAMSSGGQVVVGVRQTGTQAVAVVWQPGACGEVLPSLGSEFGARAEAVNGDGTIVGGTDGVPVRWRRVNGAWQVEQLDNREGNVSASNGVGDLVGSVRVFPCLTLEQCYRGVIWYAAGGSRYLPTLGGETTAPRGINAAGEVVGLTTLSGGNGVPFFWSESLGMRQLPLSRGGWAFAVSDSRADGTRLVVGAGGRPFGAQVWVVKP